MLRPLCILCVLLGAAACAAEGQPSVRVERADVQGPRALADQTAKAVVRDYLEAWSSMRSALEQNRAEALDPDFVGYAKDKLADTVEEQTRLGIRTLYRDRAHDLQIVFYSPDGLSIELSDKVDYDVQVMVHDKVQATQQVHARYLVILTPAEVRWRVRVLQAVRP